MYSKTSTPDTPPIVVKDNANPGSIWGNAVPIHTTSDSIWSITATFRDTVLIGEWSDPLLMTGIKGDKGDKGDQGPEGPVGPAGSAPNYKTYVYKLSNTKPEPPTGTDPNPEGWEDYPTTSGNWWQCIGTVIGSTGLVSEWSEVLPVNGRDGTAQDGKYTEFRFAINFSNITPPALDKTMRTPTGWSMTPAVKATQEFMWMIVATINPDDTLYTNWSTPTVISGEAGPQGPPGEDGKDGATGPAGNPGPAGKVKFNANGTIVADYLQLGSSISQSYTYADKTIDSNAAITTFYSSIGSDDTAYFNFNLSPEIVSTLEVGKAYSGSIYNHSIYNQQISGIHVHVGGDAQFNDEGDLNDVDSTSVLLGPNCVFDYIYVVSSISEGVVSGTVLCRNVGDFTLTNRLGVATLASRGVGMSLPSNVIARGRITLQGTNTSRISLDYRSIPGISLTLGSTTQEDTRLLIQVRVVNSRNANSYPSKLQYNGIVRQVFDTTSMWTNTPICNVGVSTSNSKVDGTNTGAYVGIMIDPGSFVPSTSHELLIDFDILIERYMA